jgi:hypothetical protein
MMMSLVKSRGPFERARNNAETIANNLYYSLTLSTYIMKLERLPLPTSVDIDDIMQNDFVIGNLLVADAIIQKAQRTSA